jgi:tetratricopeptide (TPR) repeat protein
LLDAFEETRKHSCLWTQLAQLAITIGDFAIAEAAMPATLPNTMYEASRVHLFRGQIAEAHWRLEDAAAHYREARAANPEDAWVEAELARATLKLLELDESRRCLQRQTQLNASFNVLKGQSLNISQTHIGQLIDEFCLDGPLFQELQEIRRRPLVQQIEPLKTLVLRNPDHTASAIMLLIAMRQAGFLAREPVFRPPTGRTIPHRIVQYWDAPEPPPEIGELMDSWRRMHPNYAYARYDDAAAQRFLAAHHPPAVLNAYRRAREPAQKSDVFRLAALAVDGGFYADADDCCLAPIHAFVPPDAGFVAYQEDYGTVANNFLGVAAGHSVIALALRDAVEAISRGDHDLIWLSSGPGLLTRAFCQIICQGDLGEVARSQTAILDLNAIQNHVGFHCPVRYKKTKKHWSRSSFATPTKPDAEGGLGDRASRGESRRQPAQ